MELVRIIIATVVAGWFCWFLGKTVLDGLRTGSIRHTDATTSCKRDKNPLFFWFLVALFSAFALMFALGWVSVMADAVTRLQGQ